MRKLFFISTLLILSATALTAQQAERLGSRQTMRPLPKELVKDGGSYMVLVDCDESGTDYNAGLYDSFGPEGVKYSFDLPDIQFVRYYYEKLTGEINEFIRSSYNYDYVVDDDKTFSSQSEIEVYLNPNWFYLSEYPSIDGCSAFSLDPCMLLRGRGYSYYFWNYDEYGAQYPTIYFVIDGDGHIWFYHVDYSIEGDDVKMSVIEKEEANEEYVCSNIQDLELFINLITYKTGEDRYKNKIVEFNFSSEKKAYYIVRDFFEDYCESHDIYYNEYYARNFYYEYFWQYEKFGTQFPNTIYMLDDDGHLVEYSADYSLERDYSNATWEIDPDYGNGISYEPNVGQFVYLNIDKSFYPTTPIIISQNLFNDDDNWEFLSFDVQFIPSDTIMYGYTDDGVERRRISMKTVVEGIKIMNNEGTQLGYLPVKNKSDEYTTDIDLTYVSVLNGLVYIQTEEEAITNKHGYETEKYYEGIYVIDPKDASVHTISRSLSRMNLNSTVIDQGERLDIQISESGKNDNLTISSMSGQVINSSPVRDDNSISVNTGAMPKGIYNVTLRGNGNPTENQRIIIK